MLSCSGVLNQFKILLRTCQRISLKFQLGCQLTKRKSKSQKSIFSFLSYLFRNVKSYQEFFWYSKNLSEPCTVTNSDSFLIVNIVESLGSQTTQETEPKELPLSGVPDDEIQLKLVYPKSATEYFFLDGKSLKLKQPIDRDPKDLAQISLEVICTVTKTGKRKTIPLIVTISDINDNTPR